MPKNNDLPENTIEQVKNYLLQLQNTICSRLENLDGQALFMEDAWQRPNGGGGITRVLTQGLVFAKAGLKIGYEILYMIVDVLEGDGKLKEHFDLV